MYETVTMKKTRLRPLIPILCVFGAVILYILTKCGIKAYLLGRSTGTLDFWGKAGYFALCSVLELLMIVCIQIAAGEGSTWIFDREKTVNIRKSSLENARAMKMYQDARKRRRRLAIINNAITDVLLVLLLMIYLLSGKSYSQFSLVIWLICILCVMNPFTLKARKKETENLNRILTEDCDPWLFYDIQELSRMEPAVNSVRNRCLLMQMTAAYYMNDYQEVVRKADAIQGKQMVLQEGQKLLLEGLSALAMNQQDRFFRCSEELNRLETQPRQLQVTLRYFAEIREDWQGRIDLMSPEPSRAMPYVEKNLQKTQMPIVWMDFTFMQAWIQISLGDTDRARENLKMVAARAGTMAIQKTAVEMLKTL